MPAPGKPLPEALPFRIDDVNADHARVREWMRRVHGAAAMNLPNYGEGRKAIEAWGLPENPQNWVFGAVGAGTSVAIVVHAQSRPAAKGFARPAVGRLRLRAR